MQGKTNIERKESKEMCNLYLLYSTDIFPYYINHGASNFVTSFIDRLTT